MVRKRRKAKGVRKNNFALVFAILFLALFFGMFLLVEFGAFQKADDLVNSYFSLSSNPLLVNLFLVISFLFDPISVVVLSLIIFTLLFLKGRRKDSFFFLVAPLLGEILILFFKEVIRRTRLDNLYESGFSFPSGHATISIILFCSLVYFSFKYLKNNQKYFVSVFSFIFLLTILFSRIYLGVHWFSDILAGVFLGAFVFLATVNFFENYKR